MQVVRFRETNPAIAPEQRCSGSAHAVRDEDIDRDRSLSLSVTTTGVTATRSHYSFSTERVMMMLQYQSGVYRYPESLEGGA